MVVSLRLLVLRCVNIFLHAFVSLVLNVLTNVSVGHLKYTCYSYDSARETIHVNLSGCLTAKTSLCEIIFQHFSFVKLTYFLTFVKIVVI